jgi:hypothetical protein
MSHNNPAIRHRSTNVTIATKEAASDSLANAHAARSTLSVELETEKTGLCVTRAIDDNIMKLGIDMCGLCCVSRLKAASTSLICHMQTGRSQLDEGGRAT